MGGNIVKAADVTGGAARQVREAIDRPEVRQREEESPEAAIRRLFEAVSAPNVTDAMHRKGAMAGDRLDLRRGKGGRPGGDRPDCRRGLGKTRRGDRSCRAWRRSRRQQ